MTPARREGLSSNVKTRYSERESTLTGTRHSLNYTSGPVPGRQYLLKIPVSGNTIPSSLQRIDLEITVAGRLFKDSVPAGTNQTTTFFWDGLDAYGRKVQGGQFAKVRIGYIYTGSYQLTARFGYNGGGVIEGSRTRLELGFWQEAAVPIGHWVSTGQALGGWSLDVHHIYDDMSQTLYLGDGSRRSAEFLNNLNIIETVSGTGGRCYSSDPTCGDGGLAIEATHNDPYGVALGPDGSLYISDYQTGFIRRVDPDGIITRLAGTFGAGPVGDGGPATEARLYKPFDITVGPDGDVYIADLGNYRVRKVDSSGIITTVAGGTSCTSGSCGDGGPALSAGFYNIRGIAFGPDGSLYVSDAGLNRVRRIGSDGIITNFAGTGVQGYLADTADRARFDSPAGIAVSSSGEVYIADSENDVIRKVQLNGLVTTVAGTPGVSGSTGDGGPAVLARLMFPQKIALGPDDTLYIGQAPRIRKVFPTGIIQTIAGDGTSGFAGDLGPAVKAKIYATTYGGVEVGLDGSLYIGDVTNQRIRRVRSVMPEARVDGLPIPSEKDPEIYYFDKTGRHLRTQHSLTGATLYEFGYDAEGFLVTVTDGDGNVTTIERDSQGKPTAVVGPYGHRTTFNLDSNGYLSRITNPANESFLFAYSDAGLMSQMTDARGNICRFSYDALGRLTRDENPAGGSIDLARTDDVNGYTVVKKTALNRQTSYRVEQPLVGPKKIVNTFPGGATTTSTTGNDGTKSVTFTDGNIASTLLAPDPRFGMLAPFETSRAITTPGGLTLNATRQKNVVLADPLNPFSIERQSTILGLNGKNYSFATDVLGRRLDTLSPESRSSSLTFDNQGRMLTYQPAGISPLTRQYDSLGRLTDIAQGDVSMILGYDNLGRVSTRTDAGGKIHSYDYDNANRRTKTTLPSGRFYQFGYNTNSNLVSVTMPKGGIYGLEYTPKGRLSSFTPPDGVPFSYTYNRDDDLEKIKLPGGREANYTYDLSGRPSLLTYPEATIGFSYADATARVSTLSRSQSIPGFNQTIAYSYDGPLITSADWSGITTGKYMYQYNNDLRLISMQLDSGPSIGLGYDNDGLLTTNGPFTYLRSGSLGATSRITDGNMTIDHTYDLSGRLAGKTFNVNSTAVYSFMITWNNQNRISRKVENLLGTVNTYDYIYNDDGELIRVDQGGATIETYDYDGNGNRILSNSTEAQYDPQDRLVRLGEVSYTFSNDGFLVTRGSDNFTYSTAGEFTRANISSQAVDYAYDGYGRLVARRDAAGTSQYLYGHPYNRFRITATRSGSGELTQYFYDTAHTLFAFERGGSRFYVAADQVGSPRVIVDATGTPLKVIAYDSYGRILSDTNPSYDLTHGFAGGIRDPLTGLLRFVKEPGTTTRRRGDGQQGILLSSDRGSQMPMLM